MNIKVKVSKAFVIILASFLVLASFFMITSALWDSTNTVFHNSEDIRVTVDNEDYSLQESIDLGFLGPDGGFSTCAYRSSDSGFVSCNPGEIRTGGGGQCLVSDRFLVENRPDGDVGWKTSCSGGARASIVCCS